MAVVSHTTVVWVSTRFHLLLGQYWVCDCHKTLFPGVVVGRNSEHDVQVLISCGVFQDVKELCMVGKGGQDLKQRM